MKLLYASRVLAKEGEAHSGDATFVRVDASFALFVLVDVLGHGDAAFQVAERGLQILGELPLGTTASAALITLNRKLHGTRGAVATACSLHGNEAELAGIGNVACRPLGFRCSFVPTPGVLGLHPVLRGVTRFVLSAGQSLVLHSDGISHRFEPQQLTELTPDAVCDFLISKHRHRHDDASVLVIRAASPHGSGS